MPTREELSSPKEFELKFFKENKFKRYKCQKCGKFFWSLTEKKVCGDAPCIEYEFIGKPFIPKKYGLDDIRERFLNFFEKNNHSVVNRYPVVSRWKPDTFFTGASIYCFMPWVLNRTVEPPANPLVMSQPSFRAGDLDNVGLGSGRHCSIFEMMAHHAFNNKNVYWKEETTELCFNWLKELKINPELIIFKENWWKAEVMPVLALKF